MTQLTPKSSPTPSTILAPNSELAVVLVEPRIPQNTGNITRLCVCAGVELYLVGSLGFRLDEKYLDRAAMDYKSQIELIHVAEFDEVLSRKPGWTPFYLSTKATKSYTQVTYAPKSLLVFGSETHGLPAWLIEKNPEQSVRIPMTSESRSLNLSNSVSIVLYEALRQIHAF